MRTETCVCALISTRLRRRSADAWDTFWEQGASTPSKAASHKAIDYGHVRSGQVSPTAFQTTATKTTRSSRSRPVQRAPHHRLRAAQRREQGQAPDHSPQTDEPRRRISRLRHPPAGDRSLRKWQLMTRFLRAPRVDSVTARRTRDSDRVRVSGGGTGAAPLRPRPCLCERAAGHHLPAESGGAR